MRVKASGLDKALVYPCSKMDIKQAFGPDLLEWAWLGLMPVFGFEKTCTDHPTLRGTVLASLMVSPRFVANLCVFHVREESFTKELREEFRATLMGPMRAWVEAKLGRPETENFGFEEIIVELDGQTLRTHELRFKI